MHVVLHRLDKGLLVDTDAEAVVEDDHTFNRLLDSGGIQEFHVERWDGDTIVHAEGKRFEVYEMVKTTVAAP